MTPAIAMDARPGGPTGKRQPSPEGLGNQSPRGSERRRRGTLRPKPAAVLCRKTFPGRACRTADPSASLGMTKGIAEFPLRAVAEQTPFFRLMEIEAAISKGHVLAEGKISALYARVD